MSNLNKGDRAVYRPPTATGDETRWVHGTILSIDATYVYMKLDDGTTGAIRPDNVFQE